MPARPMDLTAQEPIPEQGVQAALALMASGKLHRYGEAGAAPAEAAQLEAEFARELGVRYGVGMNSCGSTMFVALKALGVGPGDAVLSNCFTLAPVPGAVAHAGALLVLVDVTDDLTIDLDDLERKAASGVARVLLLSHMRGHICDMERLMAICDRHGVAVVEDCAHTMGAGWAGRLTGTWGRVGCFSVQSYKHANGGEGGLLVTNDDDIAARAILFSGSYMHWRAHAVRPADEVFERWKYLTPNFSLRMSNLVAAIVRPQLGVALADRCRRWNQRHDWLAAGLGALPGVRLPRRPRQEQYVQSSIQFLLPGFTGEQMTRFTEAAAAGGVNVKWFGASEPVGFTSAWSHWRYAELDQALPNAARVLAGLCDVRIPLSLSRADCDAIVAAIGEALQACR
ncbi:DegT/DnrJ/EryC1/StrS family aminotransferase [Ramlibacter tataouinensis]|uniref:Polymyxin resistance protein pmrH n=1 Tax=Ramlibacter tataouinensis (strain ATCC BAA-407 / DSM 14655 / LMG 21543 / TTB310) TaxID=365046 RepID=F5Y4I3_RAMTT|nr:aminotransferase class I/II-fold pyridoxal phosphate-dependent enzyme [Ramlibacter tataouinensis]AEG93830.1 Polymyxin resistance protein pmrH [Ramlibacter tataouinensis TTB310]